MIGFDDAIFIHLSGRIRIRISEIGIGRQLLKLIHILCLHVKFEEVGISVDDGSCFLLLLSLLPVRHYSLPLNSTFYSVVAVLWKLIGQPPWIGSIRLH